MLDDIWVRDCMTREVISCSADTSMEEVVHELRARLFSCLVIVEENKPVGLITERDLVGIFSEFVGSQNLDKLILKDCMQRNPKTLYEDLTLMEAVEQMRLDKIRHAPVINGAGELVGIMTQTDIIKGLYNYTKALEDD